VNAAEELKQAKNESPRAILLLESRSTVSPNEKVLENAGCSDV
jgi:hypothetical protein